MKYKNGQEILPDSLLYKVQDYVQDTCLYIPERNSDRKVWNEPNTYMKNIEKRDKLIYEEFKNGTSIQAITNMVKVSRNSVHRVVENQRKKEQGDLQDLRNLLYKWNIFGDAIPVDYKVWEVNRKYILKGYANADAALQNMEIMEGCQDLGEFAPEFVSTPKGQKYLLDNNWYYVVMHKLPGRKVANIYTYRETNFYTIGNIIGKIHRTLENCEEQFSYWNNNLLIEMNGWISRALNNMQDDITKVDDLDEIIQELESKFDQLPKQLVYRDVQLGNFLFINGRISGCVDFGTIKRNIRIMDICHFMTSLLWGNGDNDETLDKWLRGIELIIQGYEDSIKLTDEERAAIPCIMKCIQLMRVAEFVEKDNSLFANRAVMVYNFLKEHTSKINDVLCLSVG